MIVKRNPAANKLVLLLEGESLWLREDRLTGWSDLDMPEIGREKAKKAVRC